MATRKKQKTETAKKSTFYTTRMKGVSPLIATVILVAIVISIAGLLTGWLTAFTKLTTEKAQNRSAGAIDCSGSTIRVEEVFLINGSSATARAVVKNTGIVNDMTINSAILFNKAGVNFSATNIPLGDFDVGDLEVVVFSGVSAPNCTDFSEIVVSTNCPAATNRFNKAPVC